VQHGQKHFVQKQLQHQYHLEHTRVKMFKSNSSTPTNIFLQ
jgi:hypothetical protein